MKILENGIAVIEGDSHISRWVTQEGRLDHDQNALPGILAHIKDGDNVLDIGANIGSHTIAYSKAVGENGRVWAFEPNPVAYECLELNMGKFCPNVKCMRVGLSDQPSLCRIVQNQNAGAAMLFPLRDGEVSDVHTAVVTLDDVFLDKDDVRINFAKLDCEGMESLIIRGGEKLIRRDKPVLYVEVNEGALRVHGTTGNDLIIQIMNLGYDIKPTGHGPQYDIFCLPKPAP